MVPDWSVTLPATAWRGAWSETSRTLPEETAIAITFNRVTHAVMMATPADLHDFAVGFALSEGIVPAPGAIEDFAIVQAERGIELRLWIGAALMGGLEKRRRAIAGATGCGMCGLESLDAALRPLPPVPQDGPVFSPAQIMAATASLAPSQALGRLTRAAHAAGFWRPDTGLVAVREDVGRHNALDKLSGAMALAGEAARAGCVVLTSRISIELVQKAARMQACVVIAVSAPTALAVRAAAEAGLTLVGIARADGFEVFTGQHRIEK